MLIGGEAIALLKFGIIKIVHAENPVLNPSRTELEGYLHMEVSLFRGAPNHPSH